MKKHALYKPQPARDTEHTNIPLAKIPLVKQKIARKKELLFYFVT